jgi:3'-5' exonuclease
MDPRIFNILFIDIETAAEYPSFDEVPDRLKEHWERKSGFLKRDAIASPAEMYEEKAAIYAEYGKVICIGLGGFYLDSKKQLCFKSRCIALDSEKETLQAFVKVLANHKAGEEIQLCAHNGKEFDFPYLCRRMLINGIQLPSALNLSGKKPWEVAHIDTLEYWKFGDYKSFTSLDLLATLFNIPSSKSDISGADVNRVYHKENDLDRIAKYCVKDVIVLARLFLKLKSLPELKEENVFID